MVIAKFKNYLKYSFSHSQLVAVSQSLRTPALWPSDVTVPCAIHCQLQTDSKQVGLHITVWHKGWPCRCLLPPQSPCPTSSLVDCNRVATQTLLVSQHHNEKVTRQKLNSFRPVRWKSWETTTQLGTLEELNLSHS
jgi:hypothetical protein